MRSCEGMTKTTDGVHSVCNPDSIALIPPLLQECPLCMLDLNSAWDLNVAEPGITVDDQVLCLTVELGGVTS